LSRIHHTLDGTRLAKIINIYLLNAPDRE
jgi:hypothetical protein